MEEKREGGDEEKKKKRKGDKFHVKPNYMKLR